MPSLRSDKISDLLRKEISLIINKETKDPRLQKLNITAVKVSDDIGIATVFYTMIGESIEKEKSSIDNKVLKKFSGMVRSKLSKTMQIRRVPVIQFRFDESVEYSDNIENLLRNL
ncbi:30S ribosome-binding factor RbfA [Gammaproteobacteria bacterium]|jgi:ribosome-binding factor A|nr:30S ribosome-binding factor RbfA [Gammaproteobacteria bacterium]MDA7696042.1 30S ribosome-binding factor RbfA [Gammaproteobacteria bacterium]MDA7702409.1 30S ribosome-binding factor RbfA [Gammaproteobacteria bacterium]MDA7709313.1 30S ribosome-binding factor RbfA [Gammaproteobacteria bacterium]MDA7734990.1 30S ribosome-binding factor RbfA [Gammaproteobacteria bacterium]|tara:strand:+ start:1469 stop:1813 length:345 start_codon:yes stop_codon:yes gene_type:complete